MKVSTEIDNNFGYEKITQLVDNNIPLKWMKTPGVNLVITRFHKILLITLRHINVLHEDITYIQYYMAKWSYIIKNIRFCTLCGQSIGDECHLLFVCCNEYLVNLRRIYLPRYYVTYPSIVKMRYCLGFPPELKKKFFYFFPQNILERNHGNEIPRSRK
jgi:hypothetical protein